MNRRNTTVKRDPRIAQELMKINELCLVGFDVNDDNFIPFEGLILENDDRLYHIVNNIKTLVSKTIKEHKGYGIRWLNHIKYRDGKTPNISKSFKKYMKKYQDINFS